MSCLQIGIQISHSYSTTGDRHGGASNLHDPVGYPLLWILQIARPTRVRTER